MGINGILEMALLGLSDNISAVNMTLRLFKAKKKAGICKYLPCEGKTFLLFLNY
jgi:hypothetical protein